jgi:hypothetical protein
VGAYIVYCLSVKMSLGFITPKPGACNKVNKTKSLRFLYRHYRVVILNRVGVLVGVVWCAESTQSFATTRHEGRLSDRHASLRVLAICLLTFASEEEKLHVLGERLELHLVAHQLEQETAERCVNFDVLRAHVLDLEQPAVHHVVVVVRKGGAHFRVIGAVVGDALLRQSTTRTDPIGETKTDRHSQDEKRFNTRNEVTQKYTCHTIIH